MHVSTIAHHVAEAIDSFLDHLDRKLAVELSSYAFAKETSWARTAEHSLAHMRLVFSLAGSARPRLRAA
jgi:uncharacterized protein (UPF0276 family)